MTKSMIIGLILGIILVSGCAEKPIGGERDEHGCLGPAGYSWNEYVGACLREWELDDSQKEAAQIAVAPLSYRVTVVDVETLKCPGCFVVHLQRNDNQMDLVVNLANWKYTEAAPQEQELTPEECIAEGGRTVNVVGGESCNSDEINIGDVVGFISPNICCVPQEDARMTLEQAIEIAERSECEGKLTENSFYNENTDTWWIDLDLERAGCNPACVVSEATAEINWRCTGALPARVTDFDECVEAGYPVMESYPRQCRAPDGETYTERI